MIEFVLGRSASGKSSYLFTLAREAIRQGRPVCLIVPEQESMNAERACQEEYGDGMEVLSFRRLSDTLMRIYGGGAKPRLGDVARLGILYRAVREVKPRLTYYRKSADRVRFYEKLMSVMEDFAAYRADKEKIIPLLKKEGTRQKYQDLFLIYESYNALRRQDYRDHFDDLDTTCRLLAAHPYFENKLVLIDNFGGFTAQEYQVLEYMFLQASDCALTLTADTNEQRLFAPTLQHLSRLEQLCQQLGLPCKRTELAGTHRFASESLSVLERYLFSAKRPKTPLADDGSVRIFTAAGPDSEVRLVAQDIRRRVLSGECRYQDISVVSNVQQEYQHTVEMIFDELDIPLYTDRKVDVLSRPLFSMILHAMDAVEYNYRFEDMFSLAATYLCGLDHEQVARLENYVYMWNLRGKKWEMEWTQNPYGLDARESKEQADALLAQINEYRARLIGPLIEFAEDTRVGSARELLAAVWRLLENYGVSARLKKLAEGEQNREAAEQWLRLYDLLIELLDQLALVLGDAKISRKTLHDIMEVCLRGYRFGVVPAYMDQVHFGDMIRARSGQVKHMYVLGAVAGKFPAGVNGSNMITDEDIRQLRAENVMLSKDSLTVSREQQFCLYRTLSSAAESLTFTFSAFSADGKVQLPSTLLGRITDKLIDLQVSEDPGEMTHCKDLMRAAMFLPEQSEQFADVARFLKEYTGTDVQALRRKERNEENLPREVVEALYGKCLSASQSRMESFVGCPFHYFLHYGLRLQETEPVTFAANYVGDFVHYGMEHLLGEITQSGDLSTWDYARVDEYLAEVSRRYYAEKMQDMSAPRFDHLFDRIRRTMQLVGRSALDELRSSRFRPLGQEFKFETTIPLDGEMRARINGSIDRVDVAELDGRQWIKIVDYKTGDKKMDLGMIYNGYQLQLPLYSKMLQSEHGFEHSRIAAMEYFLAEVPVFEEKETDATSDEMALASAFRRRGLFVRNVDILHALDGSEGQKFCGSPLKKDGSFAARALLATDAQMDALGNFVADKTKEIMQRMADGDVAVCPMKQGVNACQYCKFDGICRFEYGKNKVREYKKVTPDEFFEKITKGEA